MARGGYAYAASAWPCPQVPWEPAGRAGGGPLRPPPHRAARLDQEMHYTVNIHSARYSTVLISPACRNCALICIGRWAGVHRGKHPGGGCVGRGGAGRALSGAESVQPPFLRGRAGCTWMRTALLRCHAHVTRHAIEL